MATLNRRKEPVGEMRPAVRDLLTHSAAFASLSPSRQRRIAHDMAKIASALVAGVDFPGFVAELIDGVFGAIVNASIQQMDAYAKLLADVAKSLDAGDSELPKRLGARRLATNRQQLLATMVMMGINRIAAKS